LSAPVAIEFDAARHEYRVGGRLAPSVTQILKPLVDFEHVPPGVLAAKAALGTRVHLACELDDEDDLDESSVENDVAPYLSAYRRFRRESRAEIVAVEQRVYEPVYGYCGTLDRVMRIGAEAYVVDLKTSLVTPASAGPQTAAYLHALADPAVTHRAALLLRPDGSYRLDLLNNPQDWPAFLACLTLRRFKESLR